MYGKYVMINKMFDLIKKYKLSLDQTATNFLFLALIKCPNPIIQTVSINNLSTMYSSWDGETVEELAKGKKISLHNKRLKLNRFTYFKQKFTNHSIKETTIIVVKDTNYQERQILDGIHRSVGFYQTYLLNQNFISNVKLNMLYFESSLIHELIDYKKLMVIKKN